MPPRPSRRTCSRPRRTSASWRRAGRSWISAARPRIPSRPSTCRARAMAKRQFATAMPCGCWSIEPRCSGMGSAWTPRRTKRRPGSAGSSTACPSPSSLPRPARRRCRWRRSRSGSGIASSSSCRGAGSRPPATGRFARRWTGASSSSTRTSNACLRGSRSFRQADSSAPSPRYALTATRLPPSGSSNAWSTRRWSCPAIVRVARATASSRRSGSTGPSISESRSAASSSGDTPSTCERLLSRRTWPSRPSARRCRSTSPATSCRRSGRQSRGPRGGSVAGCRDCVRPRAVLGQQPCRRGHRDVHAAPRRRGRSRRASGKSPPLPRRVPLHHRRVRCGRRGLRGGARHPPSPRPT